MAADAVIGVMGTISNGGPGFVYTSQTNSMYGPYSFIYDMGLLWSNNVVGNGGANPSVNSVTNQQIFWAGLVTDGLTASVLNANAFATDSMAALLTPLVYFTGPSNWVNHSFIFGDLTKNGLTGNSSKYIDTGVIPSSQADTAFLAIYAYTATHTGNSIGSFLAGGTPRLSITCSFTDTNAYFNNGATANGFNLVSPGNGFYVDTRINSTTHQAFFANSGSSWSQIGPTDSTSFTGVLDNFSVYIFCLSSSGTPTSPSSDTYSFEAYGVNLTSSGGNALFNRAQALRMAFGGGYR